MAIDINNPMEFNSPESTMLRDFATSPPDKILAELQANGGQTLIVKDGRYVARIEPIPQDEFTQTSLGARLGSIQPGIAFVPTIEKQDTSDDKDALVRQLVEKARQAADIHDQAA